ncbi:hypothetical protein TcCL_Unassigned02745 [Trypanosoma cruzi]|nr:hypothetical protein TcCL_Unassigned02745 [Trypanosoma cruzi]
MHRLAAPHAMRQSKTVSNTACDKYTQKKKAQQIPSTSQQLQSSSKRQKHQTVPTDSPNMASKGSEMPDAERSAFLPRDTSINECKCRALRPLDRFEATLRPHGDGSMWLAIRSGRRGKTVQRVGW